MRVKSTEATLTLSLNQSRFCQSFERGQHSWLSSPSKTIFLLLFVAATVCLGGTNVFATSVPVANPSFEILESTHTGLFPDTFGDWLGDTSEIVTAQDGILPADGNRMLQFLSASTNGPASNRTASNVQQLIGVSSVAEDVSSGNVVLEFSAWFNRVAGNSTTDTEFWLQVTTFSGEPIDFLIMSQNETWLSRERVSLFSDSDSNTWEQITMSIPLPATTDYFSIQVAAHENIVNGATFPEFDGHYADNVTLTSHLVPEPASNSMIVFGLLLVSGRVFVVRKRQLNRKQQ